MTSTARDVKDHVGERDPHALLGVQPGATASEIRRAFRQRAAGGGHPDRGGDDATFHALIRARDILLDPRHRGDDEAALRAEPSAPGPARAAPSATSQPSAGPAATGPSTVGASSAAASGTGGWGVATVVLALLGPLLWPAAIVVGHIAIRRARREGRETGAAIPIVLALLYILVYLVGLRIVGAVIVSLG